MPVGVYAKRDAIDAVRDQRARTLSLLDTLDDASWERGVVPGWRVREVAAHLISTDEAALTGRVFALGVRRVSPDAIEAWNETQVGRWASRPVPALLRALDLWGRRLARALAVAPERLVLPGPFGRVPAPWLGMLRVYDEWIHLEDVRRALGAPSDGARASVAPVIRHLFALVPWQTLPRVPSGATGRVVVRVTDADVEPFGVDLGERRYGLVEGGTTIEADAAPLVMVAAGRDPWRDAEAAGALAIRGPRDPAEVFLDALRAV